MGPEANPRVAAPVPGRGGIRGAGVASWETSGRAQRVQRLREYTPPPLSKCKGRGESRCDGRKDERRPVLRFFPLRLYFRNGYAKAQIAIARGKKQYDKRDSIAKRDAERRMRQLDTARRR